MDEEARSKDIVLAIAKQLSAERQQPLYRQLIEAIDTLVVNGTLKPGDLFPTEKALCDELGLGRSTVRRALGQLVDDGRLVRRAGKGSFVAQQSLRRSLDGLYDYSSEIRKMGMEPSSRVLSFGNKTATAEIAKLLRIPRGAKVWEVRRLRLASGEARTLECAYVPCALIPQLTLEDVNHSLYQAIATATGALPEKADEIYECDGLTAEEAELFGLSKGSHCFRVRRCATDSTGQIFECTYVTAPGDRNRYELTIHKNGAVRPRMV